MKKILLITISVMLLSCGTSRSVDKKTTEKSVSSKTEQTEKSVTEKIEDKQEQKVSEQNETNSTSAENAQVETSKSAAENTSNKQSSEKNTKTSKKKEYWENGNLKSEEETTESLSKVSAEKDYWKSSSESFKEKYEKQKQDTQSLIISNSIFATKNKELIEKVSYLEAESIFKEKSSEKHTERSGNSFWLYVLLFGSGMLSTVILQIAWKKYNPFKKMDFGKYDDDY